MSQSTARTDCVTYLPVSSHTFPHLFQWGCFVFVYSNLKVVKLTPCTHANTVFVSNKQTHHHQRELILRSATICSTRLKRFTRSSASYAGPGQDSSQSARIHVPECQNSPTFTRTCCFACQHGSSFNVLVILQLALVVPNPYEFAFSCAPYNNRMWAVIIVGGFPLVI